MVIKIFVIESELAMLAAENIFKQYEGAGDYVLRDISWRIEKGESAAIMGHISSLSDWKSTRSMRQNCWKAEPRITATAQRKNWTQSASKPENSAKRLYTAENAETSRQKINQNMKRKEECHL